MSFAFKLFAAVALSLAMVGQALADNVVSIVFSGNNWGYFKPCPT